jgi:hypothetical protein
MTWMATAIIGSAVVGAGASMYGASQASDAATSANATAAGAGSLTQQQMQQASDAQAPYAMMGYGAISPYQTLLSGQAPEVNWDTAADEARYQELAAQKAALQKQYNLYMGPGQMRSNYRKARGAAAEGIRIQAKLDELADLERRRTQYQSLQATPSQSAMMEMGGYKEGWDQPYVDRANEFYQSMQGESNAIPIDITDYEREQQRESANRMLAKNKMIGSRNQIDVLGDVESRLAEKLYGRMLDKYNRNYGMGTDWQNRLYGIGQDDFNRYTGVRGTELQNYYNIMNMGRGASNTQAGYGAQAGGAYQSAMQDTAQGQMTAGIQEGQNYASLGQIPMNALNTYLQYKQYQQPAAVTTPNYNNMAYNDWASNPLSNINNANSSW